MVDKTKNFYRCTNGHDIASTKKITKCPAVVLGSPCAGKLQVVTAAGRRRAADSD